MCPVEQQVSKLERLAEQVKLFQKTNDGARSQWHAYCDAHGGGTRDPQKHPPDFLHQFFALSQQGDLPLPATPLHELPFPQVGDDEQRAVLILSAKVRDGQRCSKLFNAAWKDFASTTSSRQHDPSRHSVKVLRRFLQTVDLKGFMDSHKNPYAQPVRFVSPEAAVVRTMQSTHMIWKSQWDKCAEEWGDGTRDPARHSPEFLRCFLRNVRPSCPQSILSAHGVELDCNNACMGETESDMSTPDSAIGDHKAFAPHMSDPVHVSLVNISEMAAHMSDPVHVNLINISDMNDWDGPVSSLLPLKDSKSIIEENSYGIMPTRVPQNWTSLLPLLTSGPTYRL